MPAKTSPTLIGAFVLGALALIVAAAFLFGSGLLFKQRRLAVTYFQGSVGGLQNGAPVNFRGVRVGSVANVVLELDARTLDARIPVYLDLEPDRLTWVGGEPVATDVSQLVDKGLRARLAMQSVVTGQMEVALDFLPDSPAKLVGADLPEIPSAPSEFEALKQTVSELPLAEIANRVDAVLARLDHLLASGDLERGVAALAGSMTELQGLLGDVRDGAKPILADVLETSRATRRLVEQGTATLTNAQGLLARDARSRQDLETALGNLADASRSFRSFADKIERNPNALVIGR